MSAQQISPQDEALRQLGQEIAATITAQRPEIECTIVLCRRTTDAPIVITTTLLSGAELRATLADALAQSLINEGVALEDVSETALADWRARHGSTD